MKLHLTVLFYNGMFALDIANTLCELLCISYPQPELSDLAQPSLTAAEESTGGKQERRRHKPNLSGLLTAAGASAAGTNAAVQELRNMRAVFGLWLVGRQACDCDF